MNQVVTINTTLAHLPTFTYNHHCKSAFEIRFDFMTSITSTDRNIFQILYKDERMRVENRKNTNTNALSSCFFTEAHLSQGSSFTELTIS